MIEVSEWRARAGLTQAQFGELMGLSQPQVSRLESNPESADVVQLSRMAQVFGVQIADLLTSEPVAALKYGIDGDGGTGLERLAEELRGAVATAAERWPEADQPAGSASGRTSVVSALQRLTRRPRVVVCGPFDAGKSTLINGLLGTRALPTRYQPTTSLVVHLRHLDVRPTWMDAPVWVLDTTFQPERWADEAHVREHRVASGGLDALREHGEHRAGETNVEAGYAIGFLDAAILRHCELLDTPGDGHSLDDEFRAGSAEQFADVLIFLSPVTGFLGDRQAVDLTRRIRGCAGSVTGDLQNVFIVATHAASARISDSELAALFDRASARLGMQMSAPADLSGVPSWGAEALRPRMFPLYDSNQSGENRGQDFLDELARLLGRVLPPRRETALRAAILESLGRSLHELDVLGERLDEATSEPGASSVTDSAEFQRRLREKADEVLAHLLADVDQRRRRCQEMIDRVYSRVVNKDAIREAVDEHFNEQALAGRDERTSPKKAAQRDLPALIMNELAARIEAHLLVEAQEFGRVLDDELDILKRAVHDIAADLGDARIATDLTGAFVGAAMGGIAVGALALWASTLGNLGAYIIAAQAAGWLSAVGISLPAGGATLTAAMASMGGPVGVAAAIVVVFALVGFTFRGSWEDRLAKAIVTEFARSDRKTGVNIRIALQQQAARFWDDTLNAVRDGLSNVVRVHTEDVVTVHHEIEVAGVQERRAQLREVGEQRAWLQDLISRIRSVQTDA